MKPLAHVPQPPPSPLAPLDEPLDPPLELPPSVLEPLLDPLDPLEPPELPPDEPPEVPDDEPLLDALASLPASVPVPRELDDPPPHAAKSATAKPAAAQERPRLMAVAIPHAARTAEARYPGGLAMAADAPLNAGTRVADRYVIDRPLGAGAMGTVYAARDGDGSAVALKTLAVPPGKGDVAERRARFEREASVCASLRHPHVVPVLGHGVDAPTGLAFLVMPLLEGEDLATLLDRVGFLEPEVAVALVVQAAAGVGAAHAAGIVHRDVKPSNLFLAHGPGADAEVVVRVTDFGLAKALDVAPGSRGALTGTGRFMGTPQYVSPEQAISAKHVDARTDVYGLAMSLYHALSGRPAFAHARSFMHLVLELTAGEAPALQEHAPWIPAALARVVHGALLRAPEVRCPSAVDLALALDLAVGVDASRGTVTTGGLVRASAATQSRLSPRAERAASWEELLRF